MLLTLTQEQIEFATQKAFRARSCMVSAGATGAFGFDGDPDEVNLHGAIAEFAVAYVMNLPWNGYGDRASSLDVGSNIQVRSTKLPRGNLLIRPNDPDDQVFILVRLNNLPEVELVGWTYGREAKKQIFASNGKSGRPPCFLFPHQKLRPIYGWHFKPYHTQITQQEFDKIAIPG